MPEKDGADDKKKMKNEEVVDYLKDTGRYKRSPDTKDATSYPPSEEVKKTQIVNTGPSAYELIKKKYEGQIMNVGKKGKKKVQDEFDLTQVAEAFGGYIVEANGDKKQKPSEQELKKKAQERTQQQRQQQQRANSPLQPGMDDEEGQGVGFSPQQQASVTRILDRIGANPKQTAQQVKKDAPKPKKPRAPRKGVDYFFDAEKAKADRDKFIAGRKAYTDSKSGIKKGEPTEKGIVDYITKARDMRQGTNANTKANRKAAEVIAKSSGKEYAQKIRDKYETDKDMSRRRGSNQPTFDQVKADIDKRNPTYTGQAGGQLPFPTRKTTVKSADDLMKDYLKKEKEKGKNIEDIEDDPRLKDIESDPQGREIRGKIERETGTRTRPFTRIGKTSGDIIKTDPKTGKETEVTPSGRVKPIGTLGRRAEKAQQQSKLAALGGFLAKSAVPATAGLEAAERLRKGEKGVALSAIQAMDIPVLSKAAGIMNAIQTVRRGQQAAADQQAMVDAATGGGGGGRKGPKITSSGGEFDREGPKPTKGGEGLAAVGGDGAETDTVTSRILATQLPNIGKRLRKGAGSVPRGLRGGTVGRRSAGGFTAT